MQHHGLALSLPHKAEFPIFRVRKRYFYHHATIRMKLPTRNIEEAVEILGSVAERTRVQPGCISCRVYYDVQEEHVIMIEEVWKSEEDLDQHLRSADYRDVLLVVEMAARDSEISFTTFSHSTGGESIEKAICGGKGGGRI